MLGTSLFRRTGTCSTEEMAEQGHHPSLLQSGRRPTVCRPDLSGLVVARLTAVRSIPGSNALVVVFLITTATAIRSFSRPYFNVTTSPQRSLRMPNFFRLFIGQWSANFNLDTSV